MNRQQKEQIILSLKEDFSRSEASFLVDYRGMTVAQSQKLRRNLRKKGGKFRVTKRRLMKLALDEVGECQVLTPFLRDQVGLIFAFEKSPAIAKVLHEFAEENETLDLVAGCLEAKLLDKVAMATIAKLPPKEVLLAQLCGALQAPTHGVVQVLNQFVVRLLLVLKGIEEKKVASH